ncbi:sensor histidine kinase, partial [Xanthovirga aplysinae]|uniref:sensor histidine kinase n=1 Tax=Xanthovirga aplysinae TaxID=2529853 RepID=UPI0012BCA9F9
GKLSLNHSETTLLFNKIKEQSDFLLDKLKNLFYASVIQQEELEVDAVKFEEIIPRLLKPFLDDESSIGIDLRWRNECSQPFYSDVRLVVAIIRNLIQNSIRFRENNRKDGSFVHIKISGDKNEVRILIVDNGQGIPLGHQSKVFDMFYKANIQTAGSGLGLFLVRKAVEKLMGNILLKSESGLGTTVEIILPSLRKEEILNKTQV